MSSAGVRSAVANYITAAAIPNLTAFFADPPFDMEDVPYDDFTTAGSTMDAIGMVFVDTDSDEVIALDGAGGRRQVTYEVSVEVMLWDTSGDASVSQAAYDALVDAVKALLRTDPQLGTAITPGIAGNGGIIQAAVDRLATDYGRPVRIGRGNTWVCWAGVRFNCQTYEFST